MQEFILQSANNDLIDYIIDIISHRQKVTVVKKRTWPDGFVSTTCQIAATQKRKRRTKAATAELHDMVRKLHADGLSNSEIAHQIGCSRAYVSKILW